MDKINVPEIMFIYKDINEKTVKYRYLNERRQIFRRNLGVVTCLQYLLFIECYVYCRRVFARLLLIVDRFISLNHWEKNAKINKS